jgi:hypothetical protein
MKLVELYFQDPREPDGQRFLDSVLMKDKGQNTVALAARAWHLGVNPGGEFYVWEVDSEQLTGFTEAHLDRLLPEEECLALGLFKRRTDIKRQSAAPFGDN